VSGHSKWSNIKHRKGKQDAVRSKVFTKLIREITVAAREGGGDESANPRLRAAILSAKAENMPSANMERAIKKGLGELPGESYEGAIYEGYGPGGVAVLVEALTDNKNRTVSEVRHLFNKYGGSMAETGAVGWIFHQKGHIVVGKDKAEEETLMNLALEAGAEDMEETDGGFEIYTPLQAFDTVRRAIEGAGIAVERAGLSRIPQNTVPVHGKQAQQLVTLLELLEDNDDVQNVYANFDMDETELAELTA
jgi:YebC/PmpR family DNA-binding regulatory protein